MRDLVLNVERAAWVVQQSMAKVKHIDKEVLEGGESDGGGHGATTNGLAVTKKETFCERGRERK